MQRSEIMLQECHDVVFKLDSIKNFAVLCNAWRSNISPQEWLGQAVGHYYRWQKMGGAFGIDEYRDGNAMATPVVLSDMELFASVAEHAPEALSGHWATLHDFIRQDDQFWVYPGMSVGDIEDGFEPSLPYVNRVALARAWPGLLSLWRG